jgi:hypothetical protein
MLKIDEYIYLLPVIYRYEVLLGYLIKSVLKDFKQLDSFNYCYPVPGTVPFGKHFGSSSQGSGSGSAWIIVSF